MAELQVLIWYLRARTARLRREPRDAGITTMEILTWSVGALILGGAIVAVVYNGFLQDAKDVARVTRPQAPAPAAP